MQDGNSNSILVQKTDAKLNGQKKILTNKIHLHLQVQKSYNDFLKLAQFILGLCSKFSQTFMAMSLIKS